MKFAHIADTHIRNLKFHYEYKIVFEKLYKSLKKEKVDYIIHCGDIAHTKTQISPEFVEMCTNFFRSLADIAPTYIILGNHDGNLKNSSRQDALTPIAEALEHPRLHLLKNSGETILGDSVAINVLSVFDEENWVKPADDSKINIALYHGSVSGVKTDTGWVMEHGEHPIEIFEGHDYAFLGDIHKTNQRLDEEGRIRYCGSTVQQNHGETNDKGFLIWDIKDKESFKCRHIELKNPRPFVTINLTPKGKMPRNTIVPEKARLRLISENNLPLHTMRKAIDVAKRRFKPESISFFNRATGKKGNVTDEDGNLLVENLRDIDVQEKLIKEYLKDYELDEDVEKQVLDLNLKYNKIAEENEQIARNVNWRLKSLEFDNLFNYGDSNSINFENLEGIIGIFGKNYSGKSSIIDSLLFTVFNSTSKNDRKNLNVINQNKEYCSGKAVLSIGDLDYTIERKAEKYIKNLKGKQTTEAKTDLEFSVYSEIEQGSESLNGLSRTDTDKNIRKVFGTLDDFLYSSMASQMDSLSFIKEGSTKRKEILANFLDLKFFETKFKLAKEDSTDTRGALKKMSGKDFNKEISDAKSNLIESERELKDKKNGCQEYKKQIEKYFVDIKNIEEKINSIPAEVIDVVKVKTLLSDKKKKLLSANEEIGELKKSKQKSEKDYDTIKSFLGTYDKEQLFAKKSKIDNISQDIDGLSLKLKEENKDLAHNQKKIKMLEDHEYDPNCEYCCENPFVKDAHKSKDHLPVNEEKILNFETAITSLEEEIVELNPDLVEKKISVYNEILGERNRLSNEIINHGLKIDKNKSCITNLLNEVEKLEGELSEYEQNKEAIENLESLNSELKDLKFQEQSAKNKSEICNSDVMKLYKAVGSLEQKVSNLQEQKDSFESLQSEISAYDLYMTCMKSNGIAFEVIRKKLPIINEEIAKILANIVDFEVFFEDDENRLDIFIRHPSYDPRPLEMGSGAEKTIAAMAIRLALLSVSSLPKGDIFILDEPGTSLDEENMQGFVDILAIIKNYFKKVLLISHLETLKDCVDMQITIDKKDGYASVNV